jgi:predicted phage tail protein
MAAKSQKSSEKPPQRLRRQLLPSSRDPLRAAEIRREMAEAAKAELEVKKLAREIARQPLAEQLLEVQIEEGRAEVARCRSQAEANDFATLRDKALLVVFLLMVILFLALAIANPTMLKMLGASSALVGVLSLAGRR